MCLCTPLPQDLGVGTDEVIALALLLGSDYTEGVKGVGIVNAMEVRRDSCGHHQTGVEVFPPC